VVLELYPSSRYIEMLIFGSPNLLNGNYVLSHAVPSSVCLSTVTSFWCDIDLETRYLLQPHGRFGVGLEIEEARDAVLRPG
jgi:hypothetical protein